MEDKEVYLVISITNEGGEVFGCYVDYDKCIEDIEEHLNKLDRESRDYFITNYIIEVYRGNKYIKKYSINEVLKTCIIINGKLNWEMVVDGQTILFAGFDNTEYFIKHYGNLGYRVIVKD